MDRWVSYYQSPELDWPPHVEAAPCTPYGLKEQNMRFEASPAPKREGGAELSVPSLFFQNLLGTKREGEK